MHSLRTTHITEHASRGTDIKTIQTNAGHERLETTSYSLALVKKAQIKAMQDNALEPTIQATTK